MFPSSRHWHILELWVFNTIVHHHNNYAFINWTQPPMFCADCLNLEQKTQVASGQWKYSNETFIHQVNKRTKKKKFKLGQNIKNYAYNRLRSRFKRLNCTHSKSKLQSLLSWSQSGLTTPKASNSTEYAGIQ